MNVQGGGGVACQFLGADDVTWAMSRGVLVNVFPPEILYGSTPDDGPITITHKRMTNLLLLLSYYEYYYYSEYSGAIREPVTITVTENAQQNIKIAFTDVIYPD